MRSLTMTLCSGIAAWTALLGIQDVAWGVESIGNSWGPAPAAIGIVRTAPDAHAVPAAPSGSVSWLGPVVGSEALDRLRGGESLVQTRVDNVGLVEGNSADGVVSGANIIGDGAFSNASGISTVIQNSGSNVLIQNGNAVNVQFVDPMP